MGGGTRRMIYTRDVCTKSSIYIFYIMLLQDDNAILNHYRNVNFSLMSIEFILMTSQAKVIYYMQPCQF